MEFFQRTSQALDLYPNEIKLATIGCRQQNFDEHEINGGVFTQLF